MNEIINEDITKILDKIQNEYFDLIITSPPYNKLEKNNGKLVKKVIYSDFIDSMDENSYQKWQIKILNKIYLKTKKGGSFFYNHKVRYINGGCIHPIEWLKKSKWKIRQEIIWNRSIAGNIRGWRFWPIEERIYWLYKPINENDKGIELKPKHALQTSIWNIRPENNNNHPAPFPIEIPLKIIYSVLDDQKNKNILDPFGGSGTTFIASQLLNHNCLSVDISSEYTKLAIERSKKITDFSKNLEKIKNDHVVLKTYKERKKEKLIKFIKKEN